MAAVASGLVDASAALDTVAYVPVNGQFDPVKRRITKRGGRLSTPVLERPWGGTDAIGVDDAPTLRELRLWALAVALFVVGDLATTGVGLGLPGVVEAGPLPSALLAHLGQTAAGFAALLGLKAVAVGVALGLWRLAPPPHRLGVPLGLACVGGIITAWNLVVVATVLLG